MKRLTHKERYQAGYKANKDVPAWECIDKLGRLEDLEEQGKLLKLPATIGDEIFFIWMDCPEDYKKEYCKDHKGGCKNCHHRKPRIMSKTFELSDINYMDNIYATREEAETASYKMQHHDWKDNFMDRFVQLN